MVGGRKIYQYVASGGIAEEVPLEGCAFESHDLQRTPIRGVGFAIPSRGFASCYFAASQEPKEDEKGNEHRNDAE